MVEEPDSLERCINQIFRPKSDIGIIIEGAGNCYTCRYDSSNNKKCKHYYPIKIMTYTVQKYTS